MKKRAQRGQGEQPMQTIPEDFEEDLDGEMEEDEERAVEDALLEAEFHENVVAMTENTWFCNVLAFFIVIRIWLVTKTYEIDPQVHSLTSLWK